MVHHVAPPAPAACALLTSTVQYISWLWHGMGGMACSAEQPIRSLVAPLLGREMVQNGHCHW